MEPDRFQQNSPLFVLGMISLFICMILLTFSLYLFPYLVLYCVYDIPDFVVSYCQWLMDNYSFSQTGAGWLVFLTFFIPAIITGWISYIASNTIDDEIYHIKHYTEDDEVIKQRKVETLSFCMKLLVAVIAVLLGVLLIQWLLFGAV